MCCTDAWFSQADVCMLQAIGLLGVLSKLIIRICLSKADLALLLQQCKKA